MDLLKVLQLTTIELVYEICEFMWDTRKQKTNTKMAFSQMEFTDGQ